MRPQELKKIGSEVITKQFTKQAFTLESYPGALKSVARDLVQNLIPPDRIGSLKKWSFYGFSFRSNGLRIIRKFYRF